MTTVLKRNEWDVLAWGVNSKNASSVSSGSTEKKKVQGILTEQKQEGRLNVR